MMVWSNIRSNTQSSCQLSPKPVSVYLTARNTLHAQQKIHAQQSIPKIKIILTALQSVMIYNTLQRH